MKLAAVFAGLTLFNVFPAGAQIVSLTDNGSTVTISNSVVSAVISKTSGNCTDLRRAGGPNLLASGGKLYFDANGGINGTNGLYENFAPTLYSVATNTPQRVEIVLTDTNLMGFNAELHYVMRNGDSGIYVFTVWRHGPGNPLAMLEQSRMVLRCDPNIFTRAYSSANRNGQMIAPVLLQTNPVIMDATYKLPQASGYTNETGFTADHFPVYTKYDWCEYVENHTIEGLTSSTVGLWMLFGGAEYFNGGPTKPNLILHGTDTTPLLLWDFHAQHFGGSVINKAANEAWGKIAGPCFIYVNAGVDTAQLWQDAQQRAAVEQLAWPYDWMNQTNYPLARGTVKGQLHISGQSTSNALLVLAQPGVYWQLQSEGYQFWTRASADGSFTIPKVRSGSYSLFAQVPGVIGIMEKTGVTITALQTNDLGIVDWQPARYQRRLFRLGTPDLGAAEFRFGSGIRQFGLWFRYLEERNTNDLNFVVGSSQPATDWYYALAMVPLETTPTNGTWFTPRYNIRFVANEIPPAPARLRVELSGASGNCAFNAFVNGSNVCPNPTTGILTINDASIYRSAVKSGRQQSYEITFNPNLLVIGTNVVSFTLRATGSSGNPWSGTKPVTPAAAIMFDSVQLEAGSLLAQAAPRITGITRSGSNLALSGTGGFPGATYQVLAATNIALPPGAWTPLLTSQFDGSGNFAADTVVDPDLSQRFYLLQVP